MSPLLTSSLSNLSKGFPENLSKQVPNIDWTVRIDELNPQFAILKSQSQGSQMIVPLIWPNDIKDPEGEEGIFTLIIIDGILVQLKISFSIYFGKTLGISWDAWYC